MNTAMKEHAVYPSLEVVVDRRDADYRRPYRAEGALRVLEPSLAYTSRYMDPRFDFAFKYIFGKEAHKDLLIDFLNSLFQGRKVIRDLQLSPTERLGEGKENRKVLFDLLCTSDQASSFWSKCNATDSRSKKLKKGGQTNVD